MSLTGRCHVVVALLLAAAALAGFTPAAEAQTQKMVGIVVKGNANISTEAILAVVKSKVVGGDYSKTQLDQDESAVLKLGFFHEVRAQAEQDPAGVRVVITVVENPKVTDIQITGNTKVPTAKLRELMLTKVGSVYNDAAFQRDVDSIEKYYHDQEFRLARVTNELGISPEGVVSIPIDEGRIEAVRIIGNKKTRTNVITREMDTRAGEVFDQKVFREDLRTLQNLDYFESVGGDVVEGSAPGKAVAVVTLKEKKTGTVSVGMGYSSREKLVGFADITENNFRGVGQQLGARWEAGQFTNRSGYELSFADPWMLGRRTSLGLQLYDRTTNRPLVLGGSTPDTLILEQRKGVGISVGKPLTRRDRLLLDFRSDDVGYGSVEGFAAPPAEFLSEAGRVTSLTFRGIRNTRDRDLDPHRGALYSVSSEFAGGPLGGRWSYTKLGADLRRFFPVGGAKPDGQGQKVLAMRLMGGVSVGTVPLSENYWVGGAESLRGYREDEFHGTRMLLYSTELRIPFGASLQGVTFFDMGFAWPAGTPFQFGDMKPAIGVGLRVVTPLGPLRLDYGFGKEGGRSHFSIGHVF